MSPLAAAAFGSFLLSTSGLFAHASGMGSAATGFRRMFVAACIFFCLSHARHKQTYSAATLCRALLCGLCFCLDFFFWRLSILRIGPGMAAVLNNCQVMVVFVTSMLMFGAKPSRNEWLAAFLMVSGVVTLILRENMGGAADLTGIGLALLSAIFYGSYVICFSRLRSEDITLDSFAAIRLVTALALPCLILLSWMEGESLVPSTYQDWAVLLGYGIVCQAIASSLLSRAYASLSMRSMALLLLLQPVLAVVWDVFLLNRSLAGGEMVAIGLVLSGLLVSQLRGLGLDLSKAADEAEILV